MSNRKSSKKFFIIAIAIFIVSIAALSASAQVTVNPGATGYTTLGAAVAAINAGTHTGALTIDISANTTETGAIVLNSSGAGSASYTSILIRPVVDGVTISGPTSTGRGLIELNGADNVTIDGDNPNTGGTNRNLTITNTAANTATFTSVIRIALATTIVTSADNNIIKNVNVNGSATGRNVSGASSSSGTENTTYGILAGGGASTVAATTAPSAIATVTTTAGTGATGNNLLIDNNNVQTAGRGIAVQGSATTVFPGVTITNNLIGNSTASAADQVYSVGITAQGSANGTIALNTVYIESFIASSTSGANRAIDVGSVSASGTFTIERNKVNRAKNNAPDFWIANGISLAAGNGQTVRNNFVSNVTVDTTSGGFYSTTFNATGIRVAAGLNHLIYNNSINMNGTIPGATPTVTACFTIISNTLTGLDIRNNACVNSQTNGSATSAFVGFFLASGGTSANNWTINNNDYFNGAAPTATQGVAQVGTTSGTGFYTQANFDPTVTTPSTNFRAYSSTLSAAGTNDNAGVKVDPTYNSATDLHIPGTSPLLNIGATIASVTNDIDNDSRPLEGAYEIGADERATAAAPGQIQLSAVTFGGNEGTSVVISATRTLGTTGAVSVSFAMADVTATGGAACGGGVDYVNTGGTLNWANGVAGTQTASVTLCTDAVIDPSETFNFTISGPTGGATLGSPSSAVVTITDVPPPFSGTYTVGSGGNYTSLTNANGIFEALNLAGASGNVTINITSDLTGELGTNALNELAGGFTVLIKPSGAPRTITGSFNGGLIRLNGADGVTIDGSTTGATAVTVGGNNAFRELTIQNTNAGTSAVVISVGSNGANGAQNNRIRNVRVLGQDPTTSLIGISLGGATPGTAATGPNNGNRVENCFVGRTIFGIYSAGQAATPNTGTSIVMNETSALATDRTRRVGILVFNDDGAQINRNSINGISTNESADAIGIGVGTQSIDTTNSTSGGVSNAIVNRNKISGVNSASTTGFSASGIAVAGGTLGANTIVNNMITGVTAPSTSPDIVAGIYVVGAAGSSTKLYYNAVSMTGDRDPLVASQMPSYGIAITGTDPIVELKNNIFYTSQTASGGGVNAVSYAIGMVTTTFANLDSNFNDFWSTGANDGGFRSGSLSTASGTSYVDVSAWQAAVADDANSIEVDPLFADPLTNLHIGAASTARNVGTPIAAFPYDFDGNPRPNPSDSLVVQVDIGADEFFIPTAAAASISGRVTTASGNGIRNAIISIQGGSLPSPVFVRTGSLGYYTIDNLEAGDTYIVTVNSKRFVFQVPTRAISLTDSINDVDFVADPQ